ERPLHTRQVWLLHRQLGMSPQVRLADVAVRVRAPYDKGATTQPQERRHEHEDGRRNCDSMRWEPPGSQRRDVSIESLKIREDRDQAAVPESEHQEGHTSRDRKSDRRAWI